MPFIVLEGIDGSGTTSQSIALLHRMVDKGFHVTRTCQPTHGPFGLMVRSVFERKFEGIDQLPNWRIMTHLFQADREHHRERLNKWLAEGRWVISDRYWMSGMTYQVYSAIQDGVIMSVASDWISSMNSHMPVPDVTIVLGVDVEVGLARKGRKELDSFEKMEYLHGVKSLYDQIQGKNVYHIDTTSKSFEETSSIIDDTIRGAGY